MSSLSPNSPNPHRKGLAANGLPQVDNDTAMLKLLNSLAENISSALVRPTVSDVAKDVAMDGLVALEYAVENWVSKNVEELHAHHTSADQLEFKQLIKSFDCKFVCDQVVPHVLDYWMSQLNHNLYEETLVTWECVKNMVNPALSAGHILDEHEMNATVSGICKSMLSSQRLAVGVLTRIFIATGDSGPIERVILRRAEIADDVASQISEHVSKVGLSKSSGIGPELNRNMRHISPQFGEAVLALVPAIATRARDIFELKKLVCIAASQNTNYFIRAQTTEEVNNRLRASLKQLSMILKTVGEIHFDASDHALDKSGLLTKPAVDALHDICNKTRFLISRALVSGIIVVPPEMEIPDFLSVRMLELENRRKVPFNEGFRHAMYDDFLETSAFLAKCTAAKKNT